MRRLGILLVSFASLFVVATSPAAAAQRGAPATQTRIQATRAPWTLDVTGTAGTLVRAATGSDAERRYSVTVLYSSAGPSGYAQNLVWMLARGSSGYCVLWCYLNDSGTDFWCWLYEYPYNQLTTLQFTGTYVSTGSAASAAAQPDLAVSAPPPYVGPDFVFRDWTRRGGALHSLTARRAGAPTGDAVPLGDLTVSPLHEVQVGSRNGWRSGGWQELHCQAVDATGNPYYLIAYSNSTQGYLIDLRGGRLLTSDFGATVKFSDDATAFGGAGQTQKADDTLYVRRYSTHQVTFTSTTHHDHPFTDVLLDLDVQTPSGGRHVTPGFWDGAGTWRARLAPDAVGTWTWVSRSNDPALNGQSGTFECVTASGTERGYLQIDPFSDHGFAFGDGTRPLPVAIDAQYLSAPPSVEATAIARQLGDAGATIATGDGLLPGGISASGDAVDVEWWRRVDARVAALNAAGITPIISLAPTPSGVDPGIGRRLWRYAIARLGSSSVIWAPFSVNSADGAGDGAYDFARSLLDITRSLGGYSHPVTTAVAAPARMVAPAPAAEVKRFRPAPAVPPVLAPFSNGQSVSALMLTGKDPAAVTDHWTVRKPVLWRQAPAPPESEARLAYWRALMCGAVPIVSSGTTGAGAAAAASAAALLRKVRWWLLSPAPQDASGPPAANQPLVLRYIGNTYIVWFPAGGKMDVDLTEAAGTVNASWYNPRTGRFGSTESFVAAAHHLFTAPDGLDWALLIQKR